MTYSTFHHLLIFLHHPSVVHSVSFIQHLSFFSLSPLFVFIQPPEPLFPAGRCHRESLLIFFLTMSASWKSLCMEKVQTHPRKRERIVVYENKVGGRGGEEGDSHMWWAWGEAIYTSSVYSIRHFSSLQPLQHILLLLFMALVSPLRVISIYPSTVNGEQWVKSRRMGTEDEVFSLQLTHCSFFFLFFSWTLFISGWVSSPAPSNHLYLSICLLCSCKHHRLSFSTFHWSLLLWLRFVSSFSCNRAPRRKKNL